jgi:acyl-CoA synthetase (AMP-forming)/AMP-acid ligase II
MTIKDNPSPQSFGAMLDRDPQAIAYRCMDHSATRGELRQASRSCAAYLRHLGLRRGDVVAVWLPDGGSWLQLLFATAQLGVLMVPISTRYRTEEALHVVRVSGARALVVPANFLKYDYAGQARAIQAQLPHVAHVVVVDDPAGLLPTQGHAPLQEECGQASDPLCTFSTSGTTGAPKLAVHDQAGIGRHGVNVAVRTEISAQSVMLCALPLYGVLSFVQMMGALSGGGACIFMQVYEAEAATRLIDQYRVTHLFGADGVFGPVLDVEGPSLATWRWGGFADFTGMSATVIEKGERRCGLRAFGLYGSSECFALTATQLPADDAAQRALAGGLPVSGDIAFRVAHVDTGAVLPDGEQGELQIRGYNVMTGYLNNPAATAGAFTEDGWFRSGDLAYKAGERFVFLARLKDSLRLRGYLVDPTEIENFLGGHPLLADAQVVGVHVPGQGDVAVAFARAEAGAGPIDEQAVLEYCRAGISNYKVPRRVIFVDDYPCSVGANGTKILKNKLREMAEQALPATA